jgi:hypothetical protein
MFRRSRFLAACYDNRRLHLRCSGRALTHVRRLRQFAAEIHVLGPFSPFGPSSHGVTTTASADSSFRCSGQRHPFGCKMRSPRVRAHPFTIRPPDLQRGDLIIGARVLLHARPTPIRLLSGSCSSAHRFAPRFLPTLGHPHAVALRFCLDDLRQRGLTPLRMRPCRAHKKEGQLTDPLRLRSARCSVYLQRGL